MNRQTVGVAPGTTVMHLGQPQEPGRQLVISNPWIGGQVALGGVPPMRMRWDLIALIGGGSLIVALTAGLIASALEA